MQHKYIKYLNLICLRACVLYFVWSLLCVVLARCFWVWVCIYAICVRICLWACTLHWFLRFAISFFAIVHISSIQHVPHMLDLGTTFAHHVDWQPIVGWLSLSNAGVGKLSLWTWVASLSNAEVGGPAGVVHFTFLISTYWPSYPWPACGMLVRPPALICVRLHSAMFVTQRLMPFVCDSVTAHVRPCLSVCSRAPMFVCDCLNALACCWDVLFGICLATYGWHDNWLG